MHGLILLVVFIIVFLNIVRVIIKEARKASGSAGNESSSDGGLLNVLSCRERNEAWMEAAGVMELQYVRPATLRARPSLRGMVKNLITEVHIEYAASGSLATVCSVQFPEKLGIDLLMMRDDAAVVAEEFANRNMLRVASLDGLDVRCSAKSAEALKSFLTPMRVNSIRNALSFYRAVRISDDYVVLKLAGECRETDLLTRLIEFTVSLASILGGEGQPEVVPLKEKKGLGECENEDLPGFKTVVEHSSVSRAPEFRQPKTILEPIKPVTDDDELLETELRSGSPRPENVSVPEVTSSSQMPEVKKPAAAPVFSSPLSRMPEVKKPEVPVFSSPLSRMPEGRKPDLSTPSPASSVPSTSGPEGKNVERETASADSQESLLDQNTLAAALFSSSFPGQKETEVFNRVKGKKIAWSGVLKSSYQFGNDFVLGSGPAVKAVFEIAEITGNYSMKTKVKAVVRLPQKSLEILKNRNGESFRFSGVLTKLESFAKEIVILDGALN